MPHLLVVEALAQLTAAILVGLVPGGEAVGYFMGLERVRCRGTVRAGDLLRLEVRLVRFRRGICRTQGEAWVVDERDGADVEAAPRTRVVRAGLTTVVRPVEPHERR
jgi:3-hydroxyacyl-[acyl-carrier-protein] dehydratase